MSTSEAIGREILIKRTPYVIFSTFSDLRNIVGALPQEYRSSIQVTETNLVADMKGIKLGVRIDEKIPFSQILFKSEDGAPFPFTFGIYLEAVALDSSLFHIELKAELNMMMKMMIGNKLQEAVDKITDQIEQALSEQNLENFDINKFDPSNFS